MKNAAGRSSELVSRGQIELGKAVARVLRLRLKGPGSNVGGSKEVRLQRIGSLNLYVLPSIKSL